MLGENLKTIPKKRKKHPARIWSAYQIVGVFLIAIFKI